MNVVTRAPMTMQQFLEWEEQQELRYEFDGTAAVAMTGGTEAHSLIQVGLLTALATRLRGTTCRAHGSHLKVQLASTVRYPDAFVTCSAQSPRATAITEPVVVFEILSPSTQFEDLMTKNAEYRAVPSIQRYVILEQTHIAALMFRRHGELWVAETLTGQEATIAMPEIGVSVPLGEIYADVTLGGVETAPASPQS